MCNKAVRQANSARAFIELCEKCVKVGMIERKYERDEFFIGRGEFSDQIAIRIAKRDAGMHKLNGSRHWHVAEA